MFGRFEKKYCAILNGYMTGIEGVSFNKLYSFGKLILEFLEADDIEVEEKLIELSNVENPKKEDFQNLKDFVNSSNEIIRIDAVGDLEAVFDEIKNSIDFDGFEFIYEKALYGDKQAKAVVLGLIVGNFYNEC